MVKINHLTGWVMIESQIGYNRLFLAISIEANVIAFCKDNSGSQKRVPPACKIECGESKRDSLRGFLKEKASKNTDCPLF